jgi:hypothetical protein
MNVYLEEKDIGRKITTYHDGFGTRQGLYVYGKDKIEVLSLSDYTKQVRKEVIREIDYGALRKMAERPNDLCYKDALCEYFLDQIQGEIKNV